MTTKENKQCIDLICKQVQENDVITKEGQRTTFLSVYKGSMNVLMGTDDEGEPVESLITFELKLKSDSVSPCWLVQSARWNCHSLMRTWIITIWNKTSGLVKRPVNFFFLLFCFCFFKF